MDLNLFNNNKITNGFVKEFIEELKEALKNNKNNNKNISEPNNTIDEYNLYEKKKIFLDNKSKQGNQLAWIMDDKSVCISEHGDGGPYFISDVNLPPKLKVGEVYERINGQYIYNSELTKKINEVTK